jgi:hypothetical protein
MDGRRSYTVRSAGWIVGSIDEIVEGPSAGGWQWHLLLGGPPGFVGRGIADDLNDARGRFHSAWQRWLEWAGLQETQP